MSSKESEAKHPAGSWDAGRVQIHAGRWELEAKLHGMLGYWELSSVVCWETSDPCWDAGMLGAELLGMLQCWKLEWPPPECGGGE